MIRQLESISIPKVKLIIVLTITLVLTFSTELEAGQFRKNRLLDENKIEIGIGSGLIFSQNQSISLSSILPIRKEVIKEYSLFDQKTSSYSQPGKELLSFEFAKPGKVNTTSSQSSKIFSKATYNFDSRVAMIIIGEINTERSLKIKNIEDFPAMNYNPYNANDIKFIPDKNPDNEIRISIGKKFADVKRRTFMTGGKLAILNTEKIKLYGQIAGGFTYIEYHISKLSFTGEMISSTEYMVTPSSSVTDISVSDNVISIPDYTEFSGNILAHDLSATVPNGAEAPDYSSLIIRDDENIQNIWHGENRSRKYLKKNVAIGNISLGIERRLSKHFRIGVETGLNRIFADFDLEQEDNFLNTIDLEKRYEGFISTFVSLIF